MGGRLEGRGGVGREITKANGAGNELDEARLGR